MACQKFKKASDIDHFQTKHNIYENTARRLATAKCFRWFEDILEQMLLQHLQARTDQGVWGWENLPPSIFFSFINPKITL